MVIYMSVRVNSDKSEIVLWTGGLKRKDPVVYNTEVEAALFQSGVENTELVTYLRHDGHHLARLKEVN